MTKRFAFWLACALGLLVPFSSFAQRKPKIIVVTHGQAADSFWLIVRNGVDAAAQETGSDVEYRSPEKFDMEAMARLIDEAVASAPEGLIVSIPDANALGKSIQAATAKLPVIAINSGLEVFRKFGCLMFIGQEEEAAGKEAGERMKTAGVKRALILNQEVGNAALDLRAKGFSDGFAGPFHHVEVLPVSIDPLRCRQTLTGYLQDHEDVDGIVALGPVVAEPALQVLDDAGKIGKIRLCTFDISPAVVQALIRKQMIFAVAQQQWLQGYLPVVFLANYAKFGLIIQNDLIRTGPSFVTPENAGRMVDPLSLGFR
ncbi:MAG: sugar ABC transporter substrate-binding protein [Verrucomicrobia bacterium]|nr:sugar ABC transporter substrate-binding protein [Verrucomicrobiota bacterium]